jgi:hypothetical protein
MHESYSQLYVNSRVIFNSIYLWQKVELNEQMIGLGVGTYKYTRVCCVYVMSSGGLIGWCMFCAHCSPALV